MTPDGSRRKETQMLGPLTIIVHAESNPIAAAARIAEHVAAIDALLNGARWASIDADYIAQDVGVHLTDATDKLKLAVDRENQWHKGRGQ